MMISYDPKCDRKIICVGKIKTLQSKWKISVRIRGTSLSPNKLWFLKRFHTTLIYFNICHDHDNFRWCFFWGGTWSKEFEKHWCRHCPVTTRHVNKYWRRTRITFCAHHVSHKMTVVVLTYHLVPASVQNIHLSNAINYEKTKTITSDSLHAHASLHAT